MSKPAPLNSLSVAKLKSLAVGVLIVAATLFALVQPRPQTTPESPATASPATDTTVATEIQNYRASLVDEGNERYRSPAGLLYTRGSAEGHRLKHLERHVTDSPNRPGPHGVFDGGLDGALAIVDEAYRRALAGQDTLRQDDDGRTVYTVQMGRRVGMVGGAEGQRRNHPAARRVRLVLEQDRLITAFPL